ncbi:MAG: hypothetical protein NUV86_04160 [Candidatus Scalindua sp.]|nr:hypothetical protein [Candidatus Scalindua sp.]MCR4343669.1 hypothetical protein [Candidatus Scalindua sp.]
MFDFNSFISSIEDSIKSLAKETLGDYKDVAVSDGKEFLETTRVDLKRWTEQLAGGELSKDDFKFLVAGKKDLAELHGLTQAGLALVKIESFRNGVIDIVVNAAFSAIP